MPWLHDHLWVDPTTGRQFIERRQLGDPTLYFGVASAKEKQVNRETGEVKEIDRKALFPITASTPFKASELFDECFERHKAALNENLRKSRVPKIIVPGGG